MNTLELKKLIYDKLYPLINTPCLPETPERVKRMVLDILECRGFYPYPDDIKVSKEDNNSYRITNNWWNVNYSGIHLDFTIPEYNTD